MAPEPVTEIRSIGDLVMHIRKKGEVQIVGIEGFCLSGKTYLGERLADQLNARLVSTDCFQEIQDRDKYYVDRLDLKELKREITEAIQLNQPVILEGICLRDIMRASSITSGPNPHVVLFIYVKVVSVLSGEETWHDSYFLEDLRTRGPREYCARTTFECL